MQQGVASHYTYISLLTIQSSSNTYFLKDCNFRIDLRYSSSGFNNPRLVSQQLLLDKLLSGFSVWSGDVLGLSCKSYSLFPQAYWVAVMLDAQQGPLTTNAKHMSNSMTATCSLKVTISEQMMMMLIVTSTRCMTMTHQNNSILLHGG